MRPKEEPPMRIMRIIARMNVGGPAVQISGLMRGVNPEKFDQRLFTGFCAENEADYLDMVARDIHAIRVNSLGRSINLTDDIRAMINLIREIRNFKPDVIHTHTTKAGFLGRLASIISRQPSIRIHTYHGHLLNGYFSPMKRFLIITVEKLLGVFTDQLLAVGYKVQNDLLKVGIGSKSKFRVMNPGLVLLPIPTREESMGYFKISSSSLKCALIGRVTQIKRPDRFLDVVSELKRRGSSLEFLIAGDGELLEICQKRIISEDLPVHTLGWCADIEKVLAISDMVVLTSDNEGTPLSLIQAGMAGLPVVATNVGSVPEIVLNNVTGFVTNLDVLEIADAIERLSSSKVLRNQMGPAAEDFTHLNFGVKRLVYEHEMLYTNLINQAKP